MGGEGHSQQFAVLLRGGRGIADCLVASLKWCDQHVLIGSSCSLDNSLPQGIQQFAVLLRGGRLGRWPVIKYRLLGFSNTQFSNVGIRRI